MSQPKGAKGGQGKRGRRRPAHSRQDRRAARNRVIVLVMAALMALSLVGTALIGLLDGGAATAPDPDLDALDEPPVEPDPAELVGPCGPTPDERPEVTAQVYDAPFELTIDPALTYLVTLETTCGDIVLELAADQAPLAVNNLVNLAEDGYFDGVVFHRVIPGFVAQFGDPAGTGCGQPDCTAAGFDPDAPTFPGYTFADELELAEQLYAQVRDEQAALLGDDDLDPELVPSGFPRGTLAMANAGPDTNGSQLFIAQGDPTLLPGPQFTVLGRVVDGLEVVDDVVASPTDELDRPINDVVILTTTVTTR